MTEKQSEIKLPSSEEILAAYDKLTGKSSEGVRQFKPSGVRYVELPGDLILAEQNPKKESHWAKMAREGHKIAWVMKDGDYLARVIESHNGAIALFENCSNGSHDPEVKAIAVKRLPELRNHLNKAMELDAVFSPLSEVVK